MNWRHVKVLYLRELRDALREKSIVINSILIPIFLYPIMLWVMFTGISYMQGKTEGMISRVALQAGMEDASEFRQKLADDEQLTLAEACSDEEACRQALTEGELDVVIQPADMDRQPLEGNAAVRILYDGSRERSTKARERTQALVEQQREDYLSHQSQSLGISQESWDLFVTKRENQASEKEMGAFILGLMLPFFLVIMVALGCFFPAIDATAGERERGTWETLMTTGTSRMSVVTSKYLYVATMGAVAGLLNVAAMTLSMGSLLAPLLRGSGESLDFTLPLLALPVLSLGAILLALFAAAGMMILAAFAKTFKEGQSFVTPFYLLLFLPIMFLQIPDLKLNLALALVPVANVVMVFREAISGIFQPALMAVTLGVEAVTICACLWLSSRIIRFEDIMLGTFEGDFSAFLKQRLLKSKPKK